jgi:V/A-type H+-transporting ATPase subunit I
MVLSLEQMAKVRVACLHNDLDSVLASLYDFGAIQVTRSRLYEPDVPTPQFKEISEALVSLRSYEKARGLALEPKQLEKPTPSAELVAEFRKLAETYKQVELDERAISESKSLQSFLNLQITALAPLRNVDLNPSTLFSNKRLEFYYAQLTASQDRIRDSLDFAGCQLLFIRPPGAKTEYVLAAVDSEKLEEFVSKSTGLLGPRILFPASIATDHSFAASSERLEHELKTAKATEAAASKRIAHYTGQHGQQIVRLRYELELSAKIAELPNKFAKTKFLDLAEGWIPAGKYEEFCNAIYSATANRTSVELVTTVEVPPTKLNNPPLVRRFEFLVRFFSLPQSTEWDPTAFIAITFPIFFGMILGDVGYGLLGIGLALFLRSKYKSSTFFKSVSAMMLLSSIVTIIFGFIYGEFFGANNIAGFALHSYIDRAGTGIPVLMALSVIFGALHLSLGIIIGAVENYNHKHYKHALAKLSWLLLEFSMFFLGALLIAAPTVTAALNIQAGPLTAFWEGAAVISIIGLIAFEGLISLAELPALLSNNLSYLRIMALGLSGVVLASIINTMPVGSSFQALSSSVGSGAGNIVNIAVAALILLVWCALLVAAQLAAFGLGMFESSIQSLRLHYVEFFSKFYKGGGLPFSPLRETNV